MSLLIKSTDLPGPPEGRRFIGADHEGVPISMFLVNAPSGSGPELHRHPYAEIFVLSAGEAEFQVGDVQLIARAGDIVIAGAGAPHRFTSVSNEQLQLAAIHTASAMDTEWLTPDLATPSPTTSATGA
ncbi:MAG: cupin domain-containing protein [Solirubrobacteraceae bacterium]